MLLDNSGALVVEYKYDAWGKQLEATGNLAATLGKVNPFRYRGYVFDEETGLYHLRSRYYNPECGRFINADLVLSWKKRLLTHNSFAYCGNVPSMNFDPNGKSFLGILALCVTLLGVSFSLSGCSSVNTLKSATNLNRKNAPAASYNCFGNAASRLLSIRLDTNRV